MNNKINLVDIARDLLNMDGMVKMYSNYLKDNYKIKMFPQFWGNTSGGFEGIGGSAITKQMTYVIHDDTLAFVFFAGRFAYKIKINSNFKEDLKNENLRGKSTYKSRYEVAEI